MEALMLEVRDKGTFIPIIAIDISLKKFNENDRYLLVRAGFSACTRCIQIVHIANQISCYDPYDWPGSSRTMQVAHSYIDEHFDELKSGDVIDVEFILGETKEKKPSEKFESLEFLNGRF